MSAAVDVRDLLSRDPFEPFRIRLTSGDSYDIRDPFSVALMTRRLFIALPRSEGSVFVPYLHIAALETIHRGRNGRSGVRGRRRRQT